MLKYMLIKKLLSPWTNDKIQRIILLPHSLPLRLFSKEQYNPTSPETLGKLEFVQAAVVQSQDLTYLLLGRLRNNVK
jgi:hypothetical protein